VPALTGDRVVLRPIERPDLPRLWELLEDIEVAARAGTAPFWSPTLVSLFRGVPSPGRLNPRVMSV
jgi:hypothetical protein